MITQEDLLLAAFNLRDNGIYRGKSHPSYQFINGTFTEETILGALRCLEECAEKNPTLLNDSEMEYALYILGEAEEEGYEGTV